MTATTAITTTTALAAALAVVAVSVALVNRNRSKSSRPLPPGPPETNFILGNASIFPRPPSEWLKYEALSKAYGPVSHIRAFDKHVIILNTMQSALDLLEKRGANYSDRPQLPMIGDLMGFNWVITAMPYGDYWRLHRRALHQHFNESALKSLRGKQERLAARFLKALLDTPEDWWSLTHWLAGANIISTVYGMEDTQLRHDPWIQLGEDTLQSLNVVTNAGFHLVDIFPSLKYIPSWFPGAGFKQRAKKIYELQIRARERPFEWVKEQIASGKAIPSITATMIDTEVDGVPLPEEVTKNCTGVAYIAGADTTLSAIKSFFLAMVRNPELQKKAQAEVDSVIPADRLPCLADRDGNSLPYLEAVLREVYRRYPPIPLGIPHQGIHEDEYEGMRIPAGALFVANIWSILRDEAMFPEPDAFVPERFLTPDGKLNKGMLDPRHAVFGFGRRICPGRYFADAELWLMAASVLSCFDILPALDANGIEIIPGEEVTQGTVVAPVEFHCRIVPRSPAKRSLILSASEQ